VWFTKNGEFLGNGFDKVAGRFYPCVWLGVDVQAQVNFGQTPFSYNFVTTLPPEYLSSLTEVEKKTKGMGVTEIRRRTQAEELRLMVHNRRFSSNIYLYRWTYFLWNCVLSLLRSAKMTCNTVISLKSSILSRFSCQLVNRKRI
jgi:hypothetical protein